MRESHQDHSRQPQVYSTYPAPHAQSPQFVQSASTTSPLMHSHQLVQRSPQPQQQQTPTKEIINHSSPMVMSHNQRQLSQTNDLSQQVGASPVVSIQQSISLQNPAFQIQQRSSSGGTLRGNSLSNAVLVYFY